MGSPTVLRRGWWWSACVPSLARRTWLAKRGRCRRQRTLTPSRLKGEKPGLAARKPWVVVVLLSSLHAWFYMAMVHDLNNMLMIRFINDLYMTMIMVHDKIYTWLWLYILGWQSYEILWLWNGLWFLWTKCLRWLSYDVWLYADDR